MEEGLAAQSMMAGPSGLGGPMAGAEQLPGNVGASGEQDMLDSIIELLLDGVDPEELLQNGVPIELIEQAMQIILQQHGQAGRQPGMEPGMEQPMTDSGLAATAYQ